ETGEVLIKVEVALTCGTDLKVYQRGYHARMITPPALFGHELAGVIEEVGPGVRAFRKGMRVVALNSAPCSSCFYCSKHQENLSISITGLMPNTSKFHAELSNLTLWPFRLGLVLRRRRCQSHSPAYCADYMRPGLRLAIR